MRWPTPKHARESVWLTARGAQAATAWNLAIRALDRQDRESLLRRRRARKAIRAPLHRPPPHEPRQLSTPVFRNAAYSADVSTGAAWRRTETGSGETKMRSQTARLFSHHLRRAERNFQSEIAGRGVEASYSREDGSGGPRRSPPHPESVSYAFSTSRRRAALPRSLRR